MPNDDRHERVDIAKIILVISGKKNEKIKREKWLRNEEGKR